MRMAYVTTYESSDVNNWSGLGSFMCDTFSRSGFQTIPIGNLRNRRSILTRAKQILYNKLSSKTYLPDRDPLLLRFYVFKLKTAYPLLNVM